MSLSDLVQYLERPSCTNSWCCTLPHRVGRNRKRYQQSTKEDQKSIETVFLIVILATLPFGDKRQSKTLFLTILDLRSLIVDSAFDCRLPGVFMIQIEIATGYTVWQRWCSYQIQFDCLCSWWSHQFSYSSYFWLVFPLSPPPPFYIKTTTTTIINGSYICLSQTVKTQTKATYHGISSRSTLFA